MKKLLLLINALIIVTYLGANPIPSPSIALSELFFDTNGKWIIELQYSDANRHMSFDTIWIKSSSGISIIKRFDIVGSEGVIVVRNDSLLTDLTINPTEDSIEISYKLGNYKVSNKPLIYGNALNAQLKSPKFGQSIAGVTPYIYYRGLYSIDKSPTIGTINDTIGMCGTIRGHIYDKNNQLLSISSGLFHNAETYNEFYPKPDGSYSTRLYSKNNHIDKLYYYTTRNEASAINIKPIDVTLAPDSVVSIDIHLLDTLMVSIKEISKNSESIIKIFPNPLSGLVLNYEISVPVKSSNCIISLVNLNGQQVAQFKIRENQGKLNLPLNIKNGMYSILLFVNNRNCSSSKILISR